MKKCIIIANGKTPIKSNITWLQLQGYSTVICADGGANHARKLNICPDYIIGDLDSITKENLEYFSSRTKVNKVKEQDDTDVEKSLKFAIRKGFTECVLIGVIGDRLDHSFGNLGIAKRYSDEISVSIISDKSVLTIHQGTAVIETCPGEVISLYGFDSKTRITSVGLKYKILNEPLPFGKKESTSNVALGRSISLKIKNGKIFMIRDLKTVKKYTDPDKYNSNDEQ